MSRGPSADRRDAGYDAVDESIRRVLDELRSLWRDGGPDPEDLADRSRDRLAELGIEAADDASTVVLLGVAEVYAVFRRHCDPNLFVSWFAGRDTEFGGRRPFDVLCADGPDALLVALNRHVALGRNSF